MLEYAKNKIKKSKLNIEPFPYFVVKDLIPKKDLDKINRILPSFSEIIEKDIYFQSASQTKKTLLPSSSRYKILNKNKNFKKINSIFRNLKPAIISKFKKSIKEHVVKKFQNTKLSHHSTYSVMRRGYIKSAHIDRRDHLLHILFYPSSDSTKGGNINIMKLKDKKKSNHFDIFPARKDLKMFKSYKVKNNFCLFTLNVPWSYHSVSKYVGKKDRKFFYSVYDFPSNSTGKKLKNKKKGNNQNEFWNSKVSVMSSNRKKKFFSE
jgi:hypothetical protein|tara:strand:+ start:393 stop:1184 length:792 start_codon:yes stop_codon:yes gene_type:complete